MTAQAGKFRAGKIAIAVAVALVLYVLSIGPVFRMFGTARTRGDKFRIKEKFYSPLTLLAGRSPPVFNAMNRYLLLWGVDMDTE